MKKRILLLGTMLLLVVAMIPVLALGSGGETPKQVEILFTNDIHSHLNEFSVVYEGKQQKMGGLSRVATIVKQHRAENEDLLLLDGGDFSMGTLFQTLYSEEASELSMLGYLEYDAVTIGNHEYDYGVDVLATMLETANEKNEYLPEILVCNAKVEGTVLEPYFKDYMIKEVGETKVAILGVFGIDALSCVPDCPIEFVDPIEGVAATVKEIKEKENPDLIICISHSGTSGDLEESEDYLLAEAVPDIDVIISAHTHEFIEESYKQGNTIIVSAGEYSSRVGHLVIETADDGSWFEVEYELIPLTEEVEKDAETQKVVDKYESGIDDSYLAQYGYTMSQVLAKNPYSFTTIGDIGTTLRDIDLGNFLSDAMRWSVEQVGPEGGPVDVAVIPYGLMRETIPVGEVTVADAFNISSLGIGPDGNDGYPVISVYLTGEELKALAEVDASVSGLMPSAQLYLSGLTYKANSNRMLLNRIWDYELYTMDGEISEIEDDRLYRVAVDYFSAKMLSSVSDLSYGVISIVPKDAQGVPFENMDDAIVYDGDQELKAWVTVAKYLESFPQEDGVSVIPAQYENAQDRKMTTSEVSLKAMTTNLNKITAMVVGVVLLIIVVVVVVVRVIRKRAKNKKKQTKK